MIKFVDGPNREPKLNKIDQENLKNALLYSFDGVSWYCWLNLIYNNAEHFFNPSYAFDTQTFLREVSTIANSPNDTIRIMGSRHKDTGHTSGIIRIKKNNAPPYGAFVSDDYIRFTIQLKSPRKLYVLNEVSVFHFLMDVPTLLWTQNTNKGVILLKNVPYGFDESEAQKYYPKVTFGQFRVQREFTNNI